MHKSLTQMSLIFLLYTSILCFIPTKAISNENQVDVDLLKRYFLPIYLIDKPIDQYGTITDIDREQILLTPGTNISVSSDQNNFFSHKKYDIVQSLKLKIPNNHPLELVELKGQAILKQTNSSPNKATLIITKVKSDITTNNQIIPQKFINQTGIDQIPTPEQSIKGSITLIIQQKTLAKRHDSIITNIGYKKGAKPGMVLSVYDFNYPNQKIGNVLLYRMNQDASLALIINSKKEIQTNDLIRSTIE